MKERNSGLIEIEIRVMCSIDITRLKSDWIEINPNKITKLDTTIHPLYKNSEHPECRLYLDDGTTFIIYCSEYNEILTYLRKINVKLEDNLNQFNVIHEIKENEPTLASNASNPLDFIEV